jgi:SAM-dependent methyltransferase
MKNYIIKKTCRLCKSSNLKKVYEFKKNPIGDDYQKIRTKTKLYDLILNQCQNCQFVQLSNVIDPKKVYGEYLYVTNTSFGLKEHFYKLADKLVSKKIIKKNSRVLEIGSNDGTLLKYIKKKCEFAAGVDPAAHLFQDKKIKNIKGLFSENLSKKIIKEYNTFDVLVANNVIANIDDLDDVFNGIKNLLKKNGFLIIETFSLNGIIQKNLIDNIYHEHLSYFSINSFQKFAKKFNLYLYDIEFLKVKGGSLRFIFQNKKIKISERVKKNIILEEKILKNLNKKLLNLNKINQNNNFKLNQFIANCDKKKLKYYGFGASVGTTTLIYDFELTKKIKYIFDNEKRRFNLYLPGTNIKVLDPKKIKKMKIDIIIIFAWRYAKQILKRNKKLFSKDTKFIVPLPKFKIIK